MWAYVWNYGDGFEFPHSAKMVESMWQGLRERLSEMGASSQRANAVAEWVVGTEIPEPAPLAILSAGTGFVFSAGLDAEALKAVEVVQLAGGEYMLEVETQNEWTVHYERKGL